MATQTVHEFYASRSTDQDWVQRQTEQTEALLANMTREKEQAEHARDCRAYAGFCTARAEQLRTRGNRTDEQKAAVYERAAQEIQAGKWLVSPTINSDPAAMRFAPLRTRLNYLGKNVRSED